MIKELWNKIATNRPTTLSLTLEGEQVSWLELDGVGKRVINAGSSSWRDFTQSVSLRGRSVRTLVHGRDTYYGIFEHDVLDHEALAKKIPFPHGTYQLRTCKVPSMRNPGQRAYFFAAALSERIEALRQRFSKQGMVLEGVEVPATAMVRELAVNRGLITHPVMLLHITEEWTHLVISCGGQPYVARDIPTGLRHFAYHWQMGKQCTDQEARASIHSSDVCQGGPLEPILKGFVDEAARTASAFEPRIEEILLSGVGVLPGLEARIQRESGVPTKIDESRVVQWRKGAPDNHRYKLALGLAL